MKGTKRASQEFTPRVGWAECKVVSINPDKEQMEKMGYTVDEEPSYADSEKDVDNQRIDFYLEEIKSAYRFRKSIYLENENVETTPDEGKEDGFISKNQFINQTGESFYAASKKDLPQWFTNFRKKKGNDWEMGPEKIYRIAKKGEAQLMDFIRKWLNFNYSDPTTNILLDMKKIFNGNFGQLTEQVGGEFAFVTKNGKEYPSTIVEMLQVKEKEVEGTLRSFQTAWKTTLPGYQMKSIRNVKFSEENIQEWQRLAKLKKEDPKNKDGRYLKDWEKLAVEISTGEWKSKNHYSFDMMREYTGEEENFVASDKTVSGKTVAADNDDY